QLVRVGGRFGPGLFPFDEVGVRLFRGQADEVAFPDERERFAGRHEAVPQLLRIGVKELEAAASPCLEVDESGPLRRVEGLRTPLFDPGGKVERHGFALRASWVPPGIQDTAAPSLWETESARRVTVEGACGVSSINS